MRPCFGRRARLLWRKRRWRCPRPSCATASLTETDPTIAAPRLRLTDRAGCGNGPTQTMNGPAKRIKRVAFGITNFVHWRIRVLLYAGRPDWTKLATVTP